MRTKGTVGWVMSWIVIVFMLFDSGIKLTGMQAVSDSFNQLGYPSDLAASVGVIALICTILYAFPRTSLWGAVLLTGYLGGAMAAHVRVGNPLFGYVLFPLYVAIIAWVGLCLRDPHVRALVPWKK